MNGNYTYHEDTFYGDTQLLKLFDEKGFLLLFRWSYEGKALKGDITIRFYGCLDNPIIMKKQVGKLFELEANMHDHQFITLLDTIGASRQPWRVS